MVFPTQSVNIDRENEMLTKSKRPKTEKECDTFSRGVSHPPNCPSFAHSTSVTKIWKSLQNQNKQSWKFHIWKYLKLFGAMICSKRR